MTFTFTLVALHTVFQAVGVTQFFKIQNAEV